MGRLSVLAETATFRKCKVLILSSTASSPGRGRAGTLRAGNGSFETCVATQRYPISLLQPECSPATVAYLPHLSSISCRLCLHSRLCWCLHWVIRERVAGNPLIHRVYVDNCVRGLRTSLSPYQIQQKVREHSVFLQERRSQATSDIMTVGLTDTRNASTPVRYCCGGVTVRQGMLTRTTSKCQFANIVTFDLQAD